MLGMITRKAESIINKMQYSLPIHNADNQYNIHDFVYTQCNAGLKVIIDSLPASSGVNPYKNIVLVKGPEKSGKTHFSRVFQAATNATVITPGMEFFGGYFILDDIDKGFAEDELFHIFNYICENDKIGLFTAESLQNFKLKDLVSRLNSIRSFTIGAPDDEMMQMLLLKHLATRSLQVSSEAIQFLLKRIPRSFNAAFKYVDFIDAASLKDKRNISVHFLSSLEFPEVWE